MNGPCRAKTCCRRRAFTLVELLLTLSLLVIIASLAWPVMDRPLANLRMRKAADKVRTEWVTARVEAMDTGRTCVFRYVPEEGRFIVKPHVRNETSGDQEYTGFGERSAATLSDSLPRGITFYASQTESDTRAAGFGIDSDPTVDSTSEWSDPILFYPDGTTSSAELILRDKDGRCINLKLRGLTGVVNVGEVYSDQRGLP